MTMKTMTSADQRELGNLIKSAKRIAKRYYRLTEKPLGITGEIGEHEAAQRLGLKLAPPRQEGYDATRKCGRKTLRIQIKTRRVMPSSKSGRVPSIRLTHDWDRVVLVLLNEDFEPTEIFEADRQQIEKALRKPGSKARNERGALAISKFKSIARSVWVRASPGNMLRS